MTDLGGFIERHFGIYLNICWAIYNPTAIVGAGAKKRGEEEVEGEGGGAAKIRIPEPPK